MSPTAPAGGRSRAAASSSASIRKPRRCGSSTRKPGCRVALGELLCVDSVAGPVQDDEGATIEMHRIRFVYRAEIVGGELRDEIGGSSDRAQWFDRNEVAAIDLVDVALLGTRVAWS